MSKRKASDDVGGDSKRRRLSRAEANVLPEVLALNDEMVAIRRRLHEHPEVAYKEVETSAFVASTLTELGIPIITGVATTGVIGLLVGEAGPGPCIGLRADMDGLPVQENKINMEKLLLTGTKSYISKVPGVMHACGHDGHVATLLTVAKVLVKRRAQLRGTVKFVFQPAEEGGGGARVMVEQGVLENPHVDEMYGLHYWNLQESGTVGCAAGPVMANSDRWDIVVTGRGGHASMPQLSVDPLVVSAHLVTALQTIVSRSANPLEGFVVTVGFIKGGSTYNVISETCSMGGTCRTFTAENRALAQRRMREIIDGVAAAFGAKISFDYRVGYPATINDEECARKLDVAASKIVGATVDPFRSMGGEDMSYYLQKVPGCFFFLGSTPKGAAPGEVPHHCPDFDIDEDAMAVGASVFVQLIDDLLIAPGA